MSNELSNFIKGNNPPDKIVKACYDCEGGVRCVEIGIAHTNENGAIYVQLHGTQIIEDGFYLFDIHRY